jgi:hypothetical protein
MEDFRSRSHGIAIAFPESPPARIGPGVPYDVIMDRIRFVDPIAIVKPVPDEHFVSERFAAAHPQPYRQHLRVASKFGKSVFL